MRVFHDYNYFQREQVYIYQLDTFEIRNMSLHFVDNVALLVTVLVFKINALLWQHTHPPGQPECQFRKKGQSSIFEGLGYFHQEAHFWAIVFIVAISLGPGACFCVFHLNGGKFWHVRSTLCQNVFRRRRGKFSNILFQYPFPKHLSCMRMETSEVNWGFSKIIKEISVIYCHWRLVRLLQSSRLITTPSRPKVRECPERVKLVEVNQSFTFPMNKWWIATHERLGQLNWRHFDCYEYFDELTLLVNMSSMIFLVSGAIQIEISFYNQYACQHLYLWVKKLLRRALHTWYL